ncbi:hypothetical protein Q3G72_027705 [Acer saccharum]|nr:hypothetical protein Q3G72_027705 [Acer saccharum]
MDKSSLKVSKHDNSFDALRNMHIDHIHVKKPIKKIWIEKNNMHVNDNHVKKNVEKKLKIVDDLSSRFHIAMRNDHDVVCVGSPMTNMVKELMPTKNQLADLFTKSLDKKRFKTLLRSVDKIVLIIVYV